MKKLAILFLLTTVLAAFTFAQVTVKGGFEVPNVTGANKGDALPVLYTEFSGSASTPLGPGSIGASFQLGTALNITDKAAVYASHGDVYLKGSYSLAVGPGTLAFAISAWGDSADYNATTSAVSVGKAAFSGLHFNADYDGIAAGPATLGFGLEYDFNTGGADSNGAPAVFGEYEPFGGTKVSDKFTARVGFGIAGFNLTYKLTLTVGEDTWISNIAYVDASYQVIDPLKVGLELDGTGAPVKDGDYFKGFSLKPYIEYAISEKTTAGASVVLGNINAEGANDELTVNPGVWISYSFEVKNQP